jgi:exodeoxyribonuclease-5
MNKSDLSPDQREAYSGILTWLNRGTATKQTLTFAGYAGTGKTTVVSVLANELLNQGQLAFCAYTGKASSVLARTLKLHSDIDTTPRIPGFNEAGLRIPESRPYCGTIHGLIYRPCDLCMPKEIAYSHNYVGNCQMIKNGPTCLLHGHPRGRCPDCERCLGCEPPPQRPHAKGRCGRCESFRFVRREQLDRDYRLIVVDECSMVDDKMHAALLSFDVPILAVGDHGQLKPIRGTGSLMLHPDIRLEKIHRQAENNPIIALSKFVRENGRVDPRFCDDQHVWMDSHRNLSNFITKSFVPGRDDMLSMAVVCWTNQTRSNLNRTVRRTLYGNVDLPPRKGDVVICLKNKPPIYNGMRGIIASEVDHEDDEKRPKHIAQVDFPEDGVIDDAEMSAHQFYMSKPSPIDWDWACNHGVTPLASLGDFYDYGYALTCHKMQGSQAQKVAVVLDGIMRMGTEERTRWVYSAVTRAQDKLVVFS